MKSRPDGIFLFNLELNSTTLNRLCDVDDLKKRISEKCPYGIITKDKVTLI